MALDQVVNNMEEVFKPKKYGIVERNTVYPSDVPSISVDWDSKYLGAHRYTFRNCTGFENGVTWYKTDSEQTIQFVMKNEDGSVVPGLQNEQLVLAILDRIKKMNTVYPSKVNDLQIKALEIFLDACKLRIDDRIARGVMGKLEK